MSPSAAPVAPWALFLLALAMAALLGSIPFGLATLRAWTGKDVRRVGSGNIGATNVLRAGGPIPAAITLALDVGKGAVAVLLARALVSSGGVPGSGGGKLVGVDPDPHPITSVIDDWAAFAAVAAHMFSPWLRFRGGKGVATAVGALAVLSPVLTAAALVVFGIVIGLTRIVSLASIAACVATPLLASGAASRGDGPYLPVVFGMCALIVFRHHANIRRLLKGTEPALGAARRGGNET